MRRRARLNAACGLLLSLIVSSQASPVKRPKRSDEKTDVLSYNTTLFLGPQSACTVGDIVYQVGEGVPGSSPCEKCTCTGQSEDGTGVNCQSVQCEVKTGCKTLHRADHCCPLYQCECTRNGKIYSNGEKLEDLENPCEVCYCQGGEIVCNRIACFVRNDCEPVYVQGSCCPEYDHCPPRDIERDSTSKINSKDKITYLSDGPLKQDSKESSKVDINNLPKIQIKEVTQGKPVNNEIRIKEVIPVSTKAPTFPREVPIIRNNEDDNQTKNDINETDVMEEENEEVSQPPQIIRIGDQLLYLKQGEIVPENTSAITPSPVFTVIGAEGLQRVEDDPDDNADKELPEVELSPKLSSEDDVAFLSTVEETKGLDQMIQETFSELYATTTQEPITEHVKSENNISDARISVNTLTEEPKIVLSTSADTLDDDIQAVPIEHLPEHNPEYPPIPEDIMILSMTEDTLEPILSDIEFNVENPNNDMKTKDDEKIVIVKRPVIPLSLPKHTKSSNVLRDNHAPEKILPDILPLVRVNKTNDGNNESFVPEEWLKENTEKPTFELSSPLLTLEAALPESILNVPTKTSMEEDDSKEYIFIANDTFRNGELNAYKTYMITDRPAEMITENTESFTDAETVQGEYRSPGEPHLVPEWERNKTTTIDDIDNANTTQNSIINFTENTIIDNTSPSEIANDNNTNYNEVEEEISFLEDSYLLDNNSSTSKPATFNEITLTMNCNESNIDDLDINEETTDMGNTYKNEAITDSENRYTSSIYSTETPSVLSTEKLSGNKQVIPTGRPLIELESFGAGETLGPFDENIYPQKQKKTSALIGDKNDDSGKKRNILADLINLVGDVAAIGHDTEVSTVLNSIDTKDKTEHKYHKSNNPTVDRDYIVPLDNIVTSSDKLHEISHIELTEYNASGDKMDSDIPMENDKVEFTTRKILIDKDIDDKKMWTIDEVGKDIELIPKVEKNPPKKDPALEKIKDGKNASQNQPSNKGHETTTRKATKEDVIIYTTVRVNPLLQTEHGTVAPNKTKLVKPNEFVETLITVDSNDKYDLQTKDVVSDTTENSFTSTIMKVTGRTNPEESTTSNDGEEKLAKRETNSQLMMSPKDIIDNKYLDALKNYFERRFIH